VKRSTVCAAIVLSGLAGAAAAQPPAAEQPLAGLEAPASAAPAADEQTQAKRRDPFRPFVLDLRKAGTEPEQLRSPLQRYELAQLTVTAILLDLAPPRAMLQDSAGMGYIVTPGTPIGTHGGVVTAIEPGRVIVEEKTLDFYGKEQVRREVLEFPRETETQAGGQ
jgi:Tfp pilus assembly protein PilP